MKKLSPDDKEHLIRLARIHEARRSAKRNRRRAPQLPTPGATGRVYLNPIEFYDRRAQLSRQKKRHASRPLEFPEVFSFIEDPDKAIATIEDFVARVMTRPGHMYISQERCTTIDLCAEAVLNALTREAGKHYRIDFNGRFPKDPTIRQIVEATGMTNELGYTADETGEFYCHSLVKGRFDGTQARANSMCDEESARLIDYLNQCLVRYGYRLTAGAQQRFVELAAEVINNCEDHSGRSEWWLAAYMRQPRDRPYGDCHIAIFNLGSTIAETLQTLPAGDAMRTVVDHLVKYHAGHRSFLDGRYSHDALWTLFALQGGVSSKPAASDGHSHRGRGTIKLLQAFMELGEVRTGKDRPVMAIVSGNTQIRLDKWYPVFPLTAKDGSTQDIITFNAERSLVDRPDPQYVKPLGRRFPGTVISLRFYIDPEHLELVPAYADTHRPR